MDNEDTELKLLREYLSRANENLVSASQCRGADTKKISSMIETIRHWRRDLAEISQ